MSLRKLIPIFALALGVAVAVFGVALVAGYVRGAVIAPWGQPDQSLLFWYLPILFIGVAGCAIGIGAAAWGLARLRAIRRGDEGP